MNAPAQSGELTSDLLAALRSIAHLLYEQAARDGGEVREAFQVARAAISKAESAQ